MPCLSSRFRLGGSQRCRGGDLASLMYGHVAVALAPGVTDACSPKQLRGRVSCSFRPPFVVIRVEATKQGSPSKARDVKLPVESLADARGRPSPPGWAVSQAYDALLPLRQGINRVRERLIALTPQLVMAGLRTLSQNSINFIRECCSGHLRFVQKLTGDTRWKQEVFCWSEISPSLYGVDVSEYCAKSLYLSKLELASHHRPFLNFPSLLPATAWTFGFSRAVGGRWEVRGACLNRQPALRHGSGYYALVRLKSGGISPEIWSNVMFTFMFLKTRKFLQNCLQQI